MSEFDVIALSRASGMCFAECHFLDLDHYEDLLSTLAQYPTEEERSKYLALVREEDRKQREARHQLECFAAAVLRQALASVQAETREWHQDSFDIWAGAAKVLTRLEFMALELEERSKPLEVG